jgi:hypothetical protein
MQHLLKAVLPTAKKIGGGAALTNFAYPILLKR